VVSNRARQGLRAPARRGVVHGQKFDAGTSDAFLGWHTLGRGRHVAQLLRSPALRQQGSVIIRTAQRIVVGRLRPGLAWTLARAARSFVFLGKSRKLRVISEMK